MKIQESAEKLWWLAGPVIKKGNKLKWSYMQEIHSTKIPKEIDETLPGHSSVWRNYYIKDGKPVVPYGRIIIKFTDEYIDTHPEQFKKGDN